MTDADPSREMCVEVVYALPGSNWSSLLTMPVGTTAAQAMDAALASGLDQIIGPEPLQLAVFGHIVERGASLRDGDRLELLRPLMMDPKQRRRVRASAAQSPKRS